MLYKQIKTFVITAFIIVSLNSGSLLAQLDTNKLFHKWGRYCGFNSTVAMGDQNNDGYDDFLVSETTPDNTGLMYKVRCKLYYGGNSIDTTSNFVIDIKGTPHGPAVGALDVNGDGYKDIVAFTNQTIPYKLSVFYGGPRIDTIPDMEIPIPNASHLYEVYVFNGHFRKLDFNGDGKEDLIISVYCDKANYYTSFGNYYIYKGGAMLTTPPVEIADVTYNLNINPEAWPYRVSFADMDGDGKTDIYARTFYLQQQYYGRDFWTMYYGDDTLGFKRKSVLTPLYYGTIIPDMNKDGKGEFFFPARDGINRIVCSKGNYPPDTLQFESYMAIPYTMIRSVGDINGDGYDDCIFTGGSMGAIDNVGFFFFGTDSTRFNYMLHEYPNYMYQEGGVTNPGYLGDINGDGCDDVVMCEGTEGQVKYGYLNIYGGKRVYTGIKEENVIKSETIELQCYPNPTTGELSIVYNLGNEHRSAWLTMFDITGQEKKRIELAESGAGKHEIKINLHQENIATGVYIINLRYYENGTVKNKAVKIQFVK